MKSTFARICITSLLVMTASLQSFGQTPIPVPYYFCPQTSSSSVVNMDYKAGTSDGYCNTGSHVLVKPVGSSLLYTGVRCNLVGSGNIERPIQIDIDWIKDAIGVLNVNVYWKKRQWSRRGAGCNWSNPRYLYTAEVHHEDFPLAGSYVGDDPNARAATNDTETVFTFTFNINSDNAPEGLRAYKIQYLNGRLDSEGNPKLSVADITSTEIKKEVPNIVSIGNGHTGQQGTTLVGTNRFKYDPVTITYYALGFGSFTVSPELLIVPCNDGNNPLLTTPQNLTVTPLCDIEGISDLKIGVIDQTTGQALQANPIDGSFNLELEKQYKLDPTGIANFYSYYQYQYKSDGGSDITFSGANSENFVIHADTKSYTIDAVSLAEGCPTESVKLLNNGYTTELVNDCTITLPDALGKEPEDIVLDHFAKYVKSKRSIIVMPGVTLEEGAELFIEPLPATPENDSDISYNFKDASSFDEYGRLIGASRSYFDFKGNGLQEQIANFAGNVILANSTLYDAQGRPALSTLPAPVRVEETSNCPNDKGVINFGYKDDFIKSAPDEIYTYSDFDLTNETTPVPVDGTTEGTLGWYYSANNGSSTDSKLTEPQVATTNYPYSRTLYYHGGPETAKGATKPGDAFKAGSGYLATGDQVPVNADDTYLMEYLSIRKNDLNLDYGSNLAGQFFKTVSYDEVNKKSEVYVDKGGNAIISLYYATQATPLTKSYSFYDNARRLLVSISPNGLNQYHSSFNSGVFTSNFADIDKTTCQYNSRGLLASTTETDAGKSEFLYRRDGQIRFSQNASQRSDNTRPERYSYTNYDEVGRPVESGEYTVGTGGFTFAALNSSDILETLSADGGLPDDKGAKTDRLFTYHDLPLSTPDATAPDVTLPADRSQHFLHGAISCTQKEDVVTTWYSYDERGRVEWVVTYAKDLGFKTMDYRYGPTGAVQQTIYQIGVKGEQFTHFYEYDENGRLYKTYTTPDLLVYDIDGKLTKDSGVTYSTDGYIDNTGPLEHQATYYYYLHGPLKRIELASKRNGSVITTVQGIDYLYTADGSLKSINQADPTQDPGSDGNSKSVTINGNAYTQTIKPDAFGMTLDYYAGDYTGANNHTDGASYNSYADQMTGLIKGIRWHSPIEPENQFAYGYNYDLKNQFSNAKWGTVTGSSVFTPKTFSPYYEGVGGYDANGNIQTLQRNKNLLSSISGFSYDLHYNYQGNTNKLQSIANGTTAFRNYEYNEIGRLTKETRDAQDRFMAYDVSGKVTGVYADAEHTQPIVTFVYDDKGFRLCKVSYDETYSQNLITWYVRDVGGNVLSTYEDDGTGLNQTELPVYGSGRIGIYKPEFGHTQYELTDHLGNVRAVIGEEIKTEYLATMESERSTDELDDFINITPYYLSATERYINHTPIHTQLQNDVVEDVTIASPDEVQRLNNQLPGATQANPVGVGWMQPVHPGDVINAEVYVKYRNFASGTNTAITNIAGLLSGASMFGTSTIIDGTSIFTQRLAPGAWVPAPTGQVDNSQPLAFLTYQLFDNDFVLQEFDFNQVSSAAQIPATSPELHQHEQLTLSNIIIKKEGYLYIYVSNESNQNMDVFFDDLRVNHVQSNIVAGGDYYPYGLEITDRQITRDDFRYGYQGKYAEKDKETGWNHFQLRDYDPVIGRWFQTDPMGQFVSPYIGMGNNPATGTDPNGGFEEKPNDYKGPMTKSDWYTSDRIFNTKRWRSANAYNLRNKKSSEYKTITQRTGFYRWLTENLNSRGFEVNWVGAAFVVANQISYLDNPVVATIVGDDVVAFGNAGNKAIFEDIFPRLSELYTGRPLKGFQAELFDNVTLFTEQYIIVQPIYMKQSNETLWTLTKMAKGYPPYSMNDLPFEGDLRSPTDRFNHGMYKVVPYYIDQIKNYHPTITKFQRRDY